MAKSKIQNKVKKIIADRVRLPIDTYKRPGAPDYPPRFSSDKFKNLVQYSICVFFRSNTILYWFLESLSVPIYRATFDLVDFRTSQKIQAEVTRKRTKMTMKTAAISKEAPQNIATSRGALSSWRPSPPAVTVLASRPKEAQPTSIQRRGETAASRKKRRGRNWEECHLLDHGAGRRDRRHQVRQLRLLQEVPSLGGPDDDPFRPSEDHRRPRQCRLFPPGESSAARERGEEYKQNSHGEIKNTEQSEVNHCR